MNDPIPTPDSPARILKSKVCLLKAHSNGLDGKPVLGDLDPADLEVLVDRVQIESGVVMSTSLLRELRILASRTQRTYWVDWQDGGITQINPRGPDTRIAESRW